MEECPPALEQLSLVDFAARLAASVTAEDGIAIDGDLRQQAQLLMHLVSSRPQKTEIIEGIRFPIPFFDEEPDFSPITQEQRDAFSFSCPSLSLDEEAFKLSCGTLRIRTESEESIPSLVSPLSPCVLLARPLSVENRDAVRLSSEAMARNILQSLLKATEWRTESWIYSLSESLVKQERELVEEGASEEDIKKLLQSQEAIVISALRQALVDIKPIDVTTSFEVLSETQESNDRSPKRRKLSADGYRVHHALLFKAVLNLLTPAGYSEITLEAPGWLEGNFANDGEDQLTGVIMNLDTNVLVRMMDKSSRIIVRSSCESLLKPDSSSEQHSDLSTDKLLPSPQLKRSEPNDIKFAIISPRNPSPPTDDCESELELVQKTASLSIPDNLDDNDGNDDDKSRERAALRMVSPQPRSPEHGSLILSPRTPTTTALKSMGPSLVSPAPSRNSSNNDTDDSVQFLKFDSAGPSLPALVEVACAAMRSW